jgi:hypothetical protein
VAPGRGWRHTAHLRNLSAYLRNLTGSGCAAVYTGRTAVTSLDS